MHDEFARVLVMSVVWLGSAPWVCSLPARLWEPRAALRYPVAFRWAVGGMLVYAVLSHWLPVMVCDGWGRPTVVVWGQMPLLSGLLLLAFGLSVLSAARHSSAALLSFLAGAGMGLALQPMAVCGRGDVGPSECLPWPMGKPPTQPHAERRMVSMWHEAKPAPTGVDDLVNYAFFVAPGVLLLKDGAVLTAWYYQGPDLDYAAPEEMERLSAQVSAAATRCGTGWMWHLDLFRRPALGYMRHGAFTHPTVGPDR